MRRTPRRWGAALALAVAAGPVLVAGCGGGGGDTASSGEEPGGGVGQGAVEGGAGASTSANLRTTTEGRIPRTETEPDTSTAPATTVARAGTPVEVDVNAQNDSGEDGTALITPVGEGRVRVTLTLASAPTTEQPAHIHMGTCDDLDPAPTYPLAPVTGGRSDTTLKVPLSTLQRGDHAINVHESAAEPGKYVACGDIPKG